METQYPGATARERFNEGLRQLIDAIGIGIDRGHVAAAAEAAGVKNADDVRRLATRLAAFTPEAAQTSRELKQFLYAKVYTSPDLQPRPRAFHAAIGELFQFFLDFPDRLPEAYRAQAEQEPLHRVICDYIAGMTDSFFERVYAASES